MFFPTGTTALLLLLLPKEMCILPPELPAAPAVFHTFLVIPVVLPSPLPSAVHRHAIHPFPALLQSTKARVPDPLPPVSVRRTALHDIHRSARFGHFAPPSLTE